MKRSIPFLDLSGIPMQLEAALARKFSEMLKKGIFSGGEEIEKLEANLGNFLGSGHFIACSNATDALEIALRVMGVGEGDEVIVPALTWVSTAEAVLMVGAIPIFADTNPDGLINLSTLDDLVTSKVKAIIPVHLYGKMVDMKSLARWAKARTILVVEDAAQAFGSSQDGIYAGQWGDIGCFSFYPTKNLGALGEAGALTTRNPDFAREIRKMINHGQVTRDQHEGIGRNARIDSIQAGFLNIKFGFFSEFQKRRKELVEVYLTLLQGIEDLQLPTQLLDPIHNCHLFVIQTKQRDQLRAFLRERGIGTAIHYPAIVPKLDPYRQRNLYPVAEGISQKCLSLPLNPFLKKEEVEQICDAVKIFFKK